MTAPTSTSATGVPDGGGGASAGAAGGVAPGHTGSRASRVVGGLALGGVALLVMYGLVWSPPDAEMADSVRLMYIHVPAASFLYTGCFIATVASAMWLGRRTPGWDALAGASAEISLLFAAVTLGTGSLWGRPTWGWASPETVEGC